MAAAEAQVVEAHGARIPLVGLGTWDLRGRTCARVVEQALRLGYRHVDTAEMYDNEREVGEGEPGAAAAFGSGPPAAALAEPQHPPERDVAGALQAQAHGARPSYRGLELHRCADRGGGEDRRGAACLRSGRDARLPRPVEGGGG